MTGLMTFNTRIYSGILRLYPPELRSEFGPEMSELFAEDLNDAWRSRGVVGVVRTWWCALCEVLRIALPAQSANPVFAVPVMAWAFGALSVCCEFATVRDTIPLQTFMAVIGSTSLMTALTAVVVVHTGNVHVISLDLKCSKSAI